MLGLFVPFVNELRNGPEAIKRVGGVGYCWCVQGAPLCQVSHLVF